MRCINKLYLCAVYRVDSCFSGLSVASLWSLFCNELILWSRPTTWNHCRVSLLIGLWSISVSTIARNHVEVITWKRFPRYWGRFKNTYELLNPRALKISTLYKKNHIFQCMGNIFCGEFQRSPLKFYTKCLTHALKYVHFIHRWKFKIS